MKEKSTPQAVWDKLKEQKDRLQDRSLISESLSLSNSMIRIPTQSPAPLLLKKKRRKTQQVTKEWTSEAAQADQISAHMPPIKEAAVHTMPRQVQRFSVRRMKALLQEVQDIYEKPHRKVGKKISVITQKNYQQKVEREQDELWRDMMKPQEERHFQIDRITNFFS